MSAENLTKEDEKLIDIARGHNVGDVALGHTPDFKRESIINKDSLKMNIAPGDLVNRANPTHNYQFAWVPFDDNDYFQDCKDDGYKVVTEAEWLNNRWEWNTPDAQKFRWNESRLLTHRNFFLMYRDETLYRKAMAKRLMIAEDQLDALYGKGVEDGLRHGMSVEGEYAGKTIDVKAPRRRSTVS